MFVLRFIGREKELAFLENEYARKSSYVALMGREGLGQTALINAFERGKNSLHFSALIEIDSQCRRRFIKTLSEYTGPGYLGECNLDSWEGFFRAIAQYRPTVKKLVIIDNVQFLIEANNNFFNILRRCWDEFLCDHNIMLITAGPFRTTTVQHYVKKDGIFQDGVVKSLHLRTFNFLDLGSHHPALTFSQLTDLYTFTGGVPKYLDMFGDGTTIMDCLELYVMNQSGSYHELPLQMLEKEVREPATYFSILNAIAEGNNRLLDIANTLGLKTNSLGPYLSLLVNLNLIERRIPVTESVPEKSRKGMYRISDHFLDFWFQFISPYQVKLDQGNTAYVRQVLEQNYVERLVKPSYIKICSEIFTSMCLDGTVDFKIDRIGTYWNGDNTSPIDIIAVDESRERLFVANCYYLSAGECVPPEAHAIISQSLAGIEELKHYKDILYGFFTNQRFPSSMTTLAENYRHILLIRETALLT